ncbi:MAG: HAMP domain-containing histidine kinase [Ruminococcaceae bacterium]|nr:HAMP domain-containing histidine kinase [Oscillospiraceae bacterium]
MTTLEIVLICIVALLCLVLLLFIIKSIKTKKQISGLTSSIEKYLENGDLTKFSTADNNFSSLQNAVCDLENALELQKHNTETETKKNSDFIADISHQFKTPIAGLKLYIEMDNELNPTDHTEKELQLIEKMEELIQKLLHLEKIKTDAYTMDFNMCEVSEIVSSIITDFKPIFSEKEFTITGSSKMRCDKSWLFEAIGNVIKNACEHTADNGKIEVIIDDSEQSTIVTVSDNGGGVETQEISKIFNRFHRTKNAKPQSAGIGLAITKAIVEKHHGTISAENTEKGLNIIMCFPHLDGYITY